MKENNIFSFIRLIQKSGKLVSGDKNVENSIKYRKCNLIILAQDASENTKNKFIKLAIKYDILIVFFGNKKGFGEITGKSERAILAVCDKNFANGLIQKIQNNNGGEVSVKNKNL